MGRKSQPAASAKVIAEIIPMESGTPAVRREVAVGKISLGMKRGPGGDFFEHDLVDFAQLISSDIAVNWPSARWCFDYEISRTKSETGVRHPVLLVENVSGYQPTTFDIGHTDETARWNVNRGNETLGLSASDVRMITRTTFEVENDQECNR